jgi:hypothetical protein
MKDVDIKLQIIRHLNHKLDWLREELRLRDLINKNQQVIITD